MVQPSIRLGNHTKAGLDDTTLGAAVSNRNTACGVSDLNPNPIGFETIQVSTRWTAVASRNVLNALTKLAVLWSPEANILRIESFAFDAAPGRHRLRQYVLTL